MRKHDYCVNCMAREKIELCKASECSAHDSWYANMLTEQNEKMRAMLKHCAGRAHANNEPENYKVIVELIAEVEGK